MPHHLNKIKLAPLTPNQKNTPKLLTQPEPLPKEGEFLRDAWKGIANTTFKEKDGLGEEKSDLIN